MEHGLLESAGLSGAGSWADLISWCRPRPGIASWLETSGAVRWAGGWPRDTRAWSPVTGARAAESQVVPHPGPWSVDRGHCSNWSPKNLDHPAPALVAVGRECLRSQLRNKHVFCKEGQITWLTLLWLCITGCMLLGVTRSSQPTAATSSSLLY